MRVDLPEPEGPMMATYSPSSIDIVMPRNAATVNRTSPIDLVTREINDRLSHRRHLPRGTLRSESSAGIPPHSGNPLVLPLPSCQEAAPAS